MNLFLRRKTILILGSFSGYLYIFESFKNFTHLEHFAEKISQLTEWEKYDLAIKEVNSWLSQDPENAEAFGWLGYIFLPKIILRVNFLC